MLIALIYLGSIISMFHSIFDVGTLLVAMSAIAAIYFLASMVLDDFYPSYDERKQVKKSIRQYLPKLFRCGVFTVIAGFVLNIIIPTPPYYYAMVGAYAASEISKSDKANVLLDKSIKLVETKIDELIEQKSKTKEK